ncbi:MAG: 2-isopropylmalate synthase, partial [Candidatus Methanomethylophilaceae archaeon]|nr:2-isopropylmalate synthase [Candidatus Methanomethylophilaceae archaeon]
ELMSANKTISIGGNDNDDAELVDIADNVLWKKGATNAKRAELEGIAVFTGRDVKSTATVTIRIDGESRVKAQVGVGPVDAALNAIRDAVNSNITLEEYKLAAITGGSDSICEVTVMVKNVQDDGNLSVGKAVGLDVVETSVDAMMSAINRDLARQ